jgi:hypothetical protein
VTDLRYRLPILLTVLACAPTPPPGTAPEPLTPQEVMAGFRARIAWEPRAPAIGCLAATYAVDSPDAGELLLELLRPQQAIASTQLQDGPHGASAGPRAEGQTVGISVAEVRWWVVELRGYAGQTDSLQIERWGRMLARVPNDQRWHLAGYDVLTSNCPTDQSM